MLTSVCKIDDIVQPIVYKRLRGLMAEHDLTGRDLSKIIGLSPKNLTMKIKGLKEWNYNELILIVRHFGFTEVKDVFPELYNHILFDG